MDSERKLFQGLKVGASDIGETYGPSIYVTIFLDLSSKSFINLFLLLLLESVPLSRQSHSAAAAAAASLVL
jgi:hypothetical protein